MKYPEMAIRCALTRKEVFKLALRATHGCLLSLIQLSKITVQSPRYSSLNRGHQALSIQPARLANQMPPPLVGGLNGIKGIRRRGLKSA